MGPLASFRLACGVQEIAKTEQRSRKCGLGVWAGALWQVSYVPPDPDRLCPGLARAWQVILVCTDQRGHFPPPGHAAMRPRKNRANFLFHQDRFTLRQVAFGAGPIAGGCPGTCPNNPCARP
jgi:hypothetical protein